MKRIWLVLVMVGVYFTAEKSCAEDYAWFTNWETSWTFPGSVIRFIGGDSLWGPVHSNDWIATQNVNGLPVFYDVVSTVKPSFRPGSPNPAGEFLGGPPEFNTPPVFLDRTSERLRDLAEANGTFFDLPGEQWKAVIMGNELLCGHWPLGTPRDSTDGLPIAIELTGASYIFFDGPLDIHGSLHPYDLFVTVGSSEDIRILADMMIDGTDTTTGLIPMDATSGLCLVSEHSILVGNTWENGRENSSFGSNVVITALIYTLRGSFEFEQMNDVNDPYVSPVSPDERGTQMITGSLIQWRRGFAHRSNLGGTGYRLKLRFDERLRYWDAGVDDQNARYPGSLIFADTPVGQVAHDSVLIDGDRAFSGALATYPFYTNAPYQFAGPFVVPVSFSPPSLGPHAGVLSFFVGGRYHSIALRGNGVSSAPPIAPEIFPNPFNNVAALSFTLPEAAHVRAVVYDVLGREAARIADEPFTAGQHRLTVDAAAWSSGVYFLRFETLGQLETRKMMLIK